MLFGLGQRDSTLAVASAYATTRSYSYFFQSLSFMSVWDNLSRPELGV